MSGRAAPAAALFARLALAGVFLSAVADRLGLWGPKGAPNVTWGTPAAFDGMVALLNPWCPEALVPVLAWGVTAAEVLLAALLLSGLFLRAAAIASGVLLALFALTMAAALGVKAPLNYSVFAAAACAFLLSLPPTRA